MAQYLMYLVAVKIQISVFMKKSLVRVVPLLICVFMFLLACKKNHSGSFTPSLTLTATSQTSGSQKDGTDGGGDGFFEVCHCFDNNKHKDKATPNKNIRQPQR